MTYKLPFEDSLRRVTDTLRTTVDAPLDERLTALISCAAETELYHTAIANALARIKQETGYDAKVKAYKEKLKQSGNYDLTKPDDGFRLFCDVNTYVSDECAEELKLHDFSNTIGSIDHVVQGKSLELKSGYWPGRQKLKWMDAEWEPQRINEINEFYSREHQVALVGEIESRIAEYRQEPLVHIAEISAKGYENIVRILDEEFAKLTAQQPKQNP